MQKKFPSLAVQIVDEPLRRYKILQCFNRKGRNQEGWILDFLEGRAELFENFDNFFLGWQR